MGTPSADVLERLKKAREAFAISESQMCREAGIKSRSQFAAARNRGSPINWDHLAALAVLLAKHGISRDWLLWGDGRMASGELLRFGPGSTAADPKVIAPRKGESRGEPAGNAPPRASKHRRRAHGASSG